MTIIKVRKTKAHVVGKKLKKLRTDRHLSLQQVATGTGLSVSALSCYESGTRSPSAVSAFRICEFFCVPWKDVFGG